MRPDQKARLIDLFYEVGYLIEQILDSGDEPLTDKLESVLFAIDDVQL